MWGANYVLRVYRDGSNDQVHQCGFWGRTTDDDVEAMEWFAEEATNWAPAFRLELQTENDGWMQVLKTARGGLGCGHDSRSVGRCSDGSWCS